MAFQDVKVMGSSHFVGIENFIRVVTNPLFPSVMKATLIYVAAVLTLAEGGIPAHLIYYAATALFIISVQRRGRAREFRA